MPTSMKIRECGVVDAAELARLRVEFLRELGQDLPDDFVATLASWFGSALGTPRLRAWVAEDDGRIVGTTAINPFERIPNGRNPVGVGWYVINVYVLPQARGAGVAGALMGIVHAAAATDGVPVLELHASDHGRPIYERLGYVVPPDFMEYRLGTATRAPA